ncbi:MAG: hypothetical protein AAGC68_07410 [Verrucomicrobiota bacterium]
MRLFRFNRSESGVFSGTLAICLLIAIPTLSHRSFADERKDELVLLYLNEQDWVDIAIDKTALSALIYIKNMRDKWLPRHQLHRMPEVETFIKETHEKFWTREAVTKVFAEVVDRHTTIEELESWIGIPKEDLNLQQTKRRAYLVEYIREAYSIHDINYCNHLATLINNAERDFPPYVPKHEREESEPEAF